MTPFIAEILGTMILILLGNGVVANVVLKGTKGNNSGWIVITTGWAFAVFTGALVAAKSGAHLNPAVTIGLAVAGKFPWAEVGSYICAQFIGAMVGAFLVWLMYKDHFDITEDEGTKLAPFSTGPAIRSSINNVISEIIGTFVLMFAILSFIAPGVELGTITTLNVALVIWVIGLALGGTTGYALNPARDLGPRIMHALLVRGNSDWGYAWIPVVGPIIGAALAACLWGVLQ